MIATAGDYKHHRQRVWDIAEMKGRGDVQSQAEASSEKETDDSTKVRKIGEGSGSREMECAVEKRRKVSENGSGMGTSELDGSDRDSRAVSSHNIPVDCIKASTVWEADTYSLDARLSSSSALSSALSTAFPTVPPKALDVASGSGRDCIMLGMRGWDVLGVDYLPRQVERAGFFAKACRVDDAVGFLIKDVEGKREELFLKYMAGQEKEGPVVQYELVHVSRYLCRELFPSLRELVAPGGFIVYHTFMKGCEKFGRPRKAEYLLRVGELREVFSGWEIVADDIEAISDGRPTSFFVARKPFAPVCDS